MRIRKPLTASVAGLVGGALVAAVALAGDVTHDRLVNSEAEPENWINHHGNYESHRFSSLDEINRDNVRDLRVAFTWAMGDTQGGGDELIVWPFSGLEGTPIAEDGFLYLTTGWGVVTKLDVRSGGPRMVWKYDPKADRDYAPTVTCCGINNRGAVLEMLGTFLEDLARLQRAIRRGEGDSLERIFTETRAVRREVIEARQA